MTTTYSGQQFSYNLIEQIGSGSSADVYKVFRRTPDCDFTEIVALKVFKFANLNHLFKNEIKCLRSIFSPRIVPFYSWDIIDGKLAFIFEYVEAPSLQIVKLEKLSLMEVKDIIFQIQRALKDLASHGVCHGDLSPNNILIDRKGLVRLIDYGLSNVFERRATPPFVAPEIERGQWATMRSDLFALGKLTELLAKELELPKVLTDAKNIWTSPLPEQRCWKRLFPSYRGRQILAQRIKFVQQRIKKTTPKSLQQSICTQAIDTEGNPLSLPFLSNE